MSGVWRWLSTVCSRSPKLAEHFVKAELKHFRYDQLEEAIAWAASSGS